MQNNSSVINQSMRHTTGGEGYGDPHVEKMLREEIKEKDEQLLSMSRQITEVLFGDTGFKEDY